MDEILHHRHPGMMICVQVPTRIDFPKFHRANESRESGVIHSSRLRSKALLDQSSAFLQAPAARLFELFFA